MTISVVSLVDTFYTWLLRTNEAIQAVNGLEAGTTPVANTAITGNVLSLISNTAGIIVSGGVPVIGGKVYLNVTSANGVNDTSTVNIATAAAVNTAHIFSRGVYDQANSAYGQANTVFGFANLAFDRANTVYGVTNTAFGQANTATTNAATADGKAVTAQAGADAAGTIANNAFTRGNTVFGFANAAFDRANTVYSQANAAYGQANTVFAVANAAYTTANNANNTAVANNYVTRSTRARLNFVPGTGMTVGVEDDSANNSATITLSAAGGTSAPGGRLTLESGVPVSNSSQTNKSTVYYTPYVGATVPVYDGSNFVSTSFAEISQTTTDTTKSPAAAVGNANYDLFFWNDSGTVRISRGPLWQKSATVTMTIASPCVVTWTSHGLKSNTPISFTTTASLPTGLVSGTTYYVSNTSIDTNTFRLTSTPGGSAVNTSGSQNGVHTGIAGNDSDRGTGAGTSEREDLSGWKVNKYTITNGPAAQRGTYIGTVRTDSAANVNLILAASNTTDPRTVVGIYNRYNRVFETTVGTQTGSWSYNATVWRPQNGNLQTRLEVIRGDNDDSIEINHITQTTGIGGGQQGGTHAGSIGIGINSANVSSAVRLATSGYGRAQYNHSADYSGRPGIGFYSFVMLEYGAAEVSDENGTTIAPTFVGHGYGYQSRLKY